MTGKGEGVLPSKTNPTSGEFKTARDIKIQPLTPEKIAETLKIPDLTLDGSDHVLRKLMDQIIESLSQAGFQNVLVHRADPIATVEDNFDVLRFPADNAGRSSRYTRYVDTEHVLRTHTSTIVPEVLRQISSVGGLHDDEEVTLVMPGLCYRRDVTDREHLGIFHQMDIWVLKKNGSSAPLTSEDLLRLADVVFRAANPNGKRIIYPAVHPYTQEGIEAYSEFGEGGELEIFEAGLAHPEVLRSCGLNPEEYSGLALGMGLDRLIMARKGMPDIRLLRAESPEIASQMKDFEPYRDVSDQPPIVRDISFVVDSGVSIEDVSDLLQEAFGDQAHLLEKVDITTVTPFDELPLQAKERLGISPGQVNVLARFILRHPDRTLTKNEVNEMYSRVYASVHAGSAQGYVIN